MIFVKIFGTFLLAYLALCVYLYLFQERQMFFPPPASHLSENIPLHNKISLDIDGLELQGIYSGNINNKKPVILYFGGNAEDVFYNFPDFMSEFDAQFVAFNYRGFAGNEGKPTISNLIKDAQAITDKIIKKFSLVPSNIFLMGRSLGAAIAVQISKNEKYAGIILISPFDSMVNIGKRYFPFFPVSLILKHPLDSLAIAKKSHTSLLVLGAEQDNIIPTEYSKSLFDSWAANDKQFVIINNTGHNTIHHGASYFTSINDFIRRFP